MADVQPTTDPNTVTQKGPTSDSDEKGTPTRKKSSVATANVKRKPSFVEKVRRSTTLENISNNIGSTDIGVDGILGYGLKGFVDAHKDVDKAIANRNRPNILKTDTHYALRYTT
jgi:hypothetical protein